MNRQPIRVLIVEDDAVDRLACRRAISKDSDCQFTILEADTARHGLEMAARERPDCILLDYNLPDLNGLEFLSELAAEAGEAKMPVMLLTGGDNAVVAAEAMKRGAWDYLGKDIDGRYLEVLSAAIQRMLRERQLAEGKRRAEAQFRSLVEQIEAITYIVALGANGMLLYISPQIRHLDYTPEEYLADPLLYDAQIHPDDRDWAKQAFVERKISGNSTPLEYRLLTRNGDTVWFRDQAKLVTDESGRNLFLQGILVDITQSKLTEEALRESQAQLRQLGAHLEKIKEAERKRIAQEIHDELGGLLTGIKANVSVYLGRNARAGKAPDPLLQDVVNLADTGFQAVRRVITDLRPSVLDQLGVWAALEWYTDQIMMRSGLDCICHISPEAAALEVGPDLSTMLFRIVEEALTNVVRHANASLIAVRATVEQDNLVLSIEDNGEGIEETTHRGSWGIVGMLERARHFGGELDVSGHRGQGSVVTLRLPLENLK